MALRDALQDFASVAGIAFAETTGPEADRAILRFAKSDATGTAWAYAPGRSEKSGDVWFSNSGDLVAGARPGNYAWFTMLHEIGHALGLKHPHEVKGNAPAMPKDRDSVEYSVMSYHSFVGMKGKAYENGDESYPQSLMMYDIAALQEIYGANFSFRNTDTTYAWNAKSGQLLVNGVAEPKPLANKVFLTVWDGGGNDTYSFASYKTNLKVSLSAGGWTVTAKAQLADVGKGGLARGNIANALLHEGNPASLIENAIGGSGNDRITGNQADNVLTGGRGDDRLNGKGGVDTATFKGKASNYEIEKAKGGWIVTDTRKGGGDGSDQLKNMEVLKFKDRTVLTETRKAKAAAPEATAKSGAKEKVSMHQGLESNPASPLDDGYTGSLLGGRQPHEASHILLGHDLAASFDLHL